MLVHIVIVPDAARMGPDLTRMGKVEDLPDELGRLMLGNGTGREPTDDEVADYHLRQQIEQKAADAEADGDLAKLTKADLVKLAEERGIDLPPHATKADIAATLEDHDRGVVDVPLPDDAGTEDH